VLPHSIQRYSNERNDNAYHACGDQRLEDRRRTKFNDILTVRVKVGQFMLIGFHDKPPVSKSLCAICLSVRAIQDGPRHNQLQRTSKLLAETEQF
jgi:hypothetical protein